MVVLNFRFIDLESDNLCRYDFVDVYNGHANGQRIGRFCGTFRPGSLVASGNKMMVQMISDANTAGSGFMATFSAAAPDGKGTRFHTGAVTTVMAGLGDSLPAVCRAPFLALYVSSYKAQWQFSKSQGTPTSHQGPFSEVSPFQKAHMYSCKKSNIKFMGLNEKLDSTSSSAKASLMVSFSPCLFTFVYFYDNSLQT